MNRYGCDDRIWQEAQVCAVLRALNPPNPFTTQIDCMRGFKPLQYASEERSFLQAAQVTTLEFGFSRISFAFLVLVLVYRTYQKGGCGWKPFSFGSVPLSLPRVCGRAGNYLGLVFLGSLSLSRSCVGLPNVPEVRGYLGCLLYTSPSPRD